jgi:hypothetical protein
LSEDEAVLLDMLVILVGSDRKYILGLEEEDLSGI